MWKKKQTKCGKKVKKWKEQKEMWKERQTLQSQHGSCKDIVDCTKWRGLSAGGKDDRRT